MSLHCRHHLFAVDSTANKWCFWGGKWHITDKTTQERHDGRRPAETWKAGGPDRDWFAQGERQNPDPAYPHKEGHNYFLFLIHLQTGENFKHLNIHADGRPQETWGWRWHTRTGGNHQELLGRWTWGSCPVNFIINQKIVKVTSSSSLFCDDAENRMIKSQSIFFRAAQSCALNRLVKADSKVEYLKIS